jgi:hypothetical protein
MPLPTQEGRAHKTARGRSLPRQSFLVQHRAIAVILGLFLVLGILYSLITPLFEASDELWHYPFVKRLADGGGLPVQYPDQIGAWRQEGSQPPLYYALGALVTSWIDTSDMDEVRWINPHADIGIPTLDRNVNMAVHRSPLGGPEPWPWRGTVLAMYLVRWMSVLMGAVTVLMGYLLAREIYPRDARPAIGAAVFTALNPMVLFITASVNNDALVIMLSAISLWLMVRYLAMEPRAWHWVLLGLVLGLASLSKASALGLLPLAALTGVIVSWRAHRGEPRRRFWGALLHTGLLIGLPVLLVAGWWYYRNWLLYRDPLGLKAFVAIVGARYPRPTLWQLLGEWKGFVMSYWGFFGGVNVPAPSWVYWALSIVGLAGLLGAPLYVWRRNSEKPLSATQWLQTALMALWPLVVLVSLVRWTLMTIASQGRLMFSALTALSLLMAMGLAGWLPRRRFGEWFAERAGPLLFGGILLISATALPFSTIRPAYRHPQILTEDDIAGRYIPLDAEFEGAARLLGYRADGEVISPGGNVSLTLYWQCLAPMAEDYSVFVHLLAENDLIIAQRDMYPGQGTYPTTLWSAGDILADTYVLPVSPAAMTPSEAQFEAGLYRLQTGARLQATRPTGERLGDNVRFGRVTLPTRVVDGIPNPVFFNLEGRIALVGYELDRTAARPDETFRLVLYWRALRDGDTNYSVFTQVLGDQHRIWAQKDSWPLGGDAPTATWRKGQSIEDPYELRVASDAPPGVYDLQAGMYNQNGVRLNLLGQGGHVQDTRILLGKVRILPREP